MEPVVRGISPAPDGGWMKRLWPFLRPHKGRIVVTLGASFVGMGVAAVLPLLMRSIVDDAIDARAAPLAPLLGLMLGLGLIQAVSSGLRRFVAGRIAYDLEFDLRNALYDHLQRLDFARHDAFQTGQLVARANGDVRMIERILSFLPFVLGSVVMFVMSVVAMASLSLPLMLASLPVIPMLFGAAVLMRRRLYPASWDAQDRTGRVTQAVEDAVTGVRVVKGFGQERRELERLLATSGGLFGARMRTIRIVGRYQPFMQAAPQIGQVIVLGVGGWLALQGSITIGTFLAFSSYLVQLAGPVQAVSWLLPMAQMGRASADRVLEVLDAEPLVQEPETTAAVPPGSVGVRFEGVRFGYGSEAVLDGFDLDIAPGETVALVGGSGSGKSTVALLPSRFYDPWSGTVSVGGVDVRQASLEELRSRIGVVFEEAFLFSDTIAANIAYGRPDASRETIEAAARAAEADGFIAELPDGYETVVGERGLTLSGGQRQRIALARAILTDPDVLVLDDATSSVDPKVEREIHATLTGLTTSRTTILVAHRRSTLDLADRIVVVQDGRVLDSGTHEELWTRCLRYRDLLAGPEGALLEAPHADGITPDAWPPAPQRELGEGGWMGMPPSPEIREAVAKLGEPIDRPDVDIERETSPALDLTPRGFLRPYALRFTVGFVLVGLVSLAALAGPALVRHAVDAGIVAERPDVLWRTVAVFVAVVCGAWALGWATTRYTGRTSERLLFALRARIFSHLQRLSLGYYEREMAGRIVTRVTSDVESVAGFLQTGLVQAGVQLLTLLGVTAVLVSMNARLAIVTLAVVPVLALASVWFRKRAADAYVAVRERIAEVNAYLQESIAGVRVAQAFARERFNMGDFRRVADAYREAQLRAQRLLALYFPVVEFLAVAATVLVLGVGARMVEDGVLGVGELIAFVLYLGTVFAPIQSLSQLFDTYQQASAAFGKIQDLLHTPTMTPEQEDATRPERLTGRISLEGVRFAYPGTSEEVLHGIDLEVAPGETVALVGETGAGKSTIEKLVARFYDPTEGRVTVDGRDLRELDLEAYRRQLGFVPQEAHLFAGSVRDNIAYARPDATDAEVEWAARAVGAHRFIASLPYGYQTPILERGRSLSSGQRQLIALARALLVDPPVLLLDEATSNLDMATEARVVGAMDLVSSGRTTILIAHRLATAMRADRIVVIDDGRIVEEGSHAELLARAGRYAALWDAYGADLLTA